jgi:predicted ATPase
MPFSDFRTSVNLPRNMGNYPELPDLEIVQLTFEILDDIIKFFRDKLRRVYFLSSLRGFVEPTVDASSDAEWIGKDGEDLITILSKCFASGKYNEKGNKIEHWANEFGISGLKSGFVSGGRLGSDFSDPILKTQLALSLASHGSRQILAILTQLFWSEPGDLILIEEPEISLHPEAQILLPELFADAVKDNKQIICSTHSPFLILALPRVIQKSKISGSDIGIYEIEKTEKGTISKRKEIDERGYVKGWIETFAKVDEELFSEYLEGLEEEGA